MATIVLINDDPGDCPLVKIFLRSICHKYDIVGFFNKPIRKIELLVWMLLCA